MSAMPEFVSIPTSVRTSVKSPAPASQRKWRRQQSGVRPEKYLSSILAMVTATGLAAAWIGGYVQTAVVGYQISHLQTRLAELEQSNRSLAARAAQLEDPARLDAAAAHLAMQRVDPTRTVHVAIASSSTAGQSSTTLALASTSGW